MSIQLCQFNIPRNHDILMFPFLKRIKIRKKRRACGKIIWQWRNTSCRWNFRLWFFLLHLKDPKNPSLGFSRFIILMMNWLWIYGLWVRFTHCLLNTIRVLYMRLCTAQRVCVFKKFTEFGPRYCYVTKCPMILFIEITEACIKSGRFLQFMLG